MVKFYLGQTVWQVYECMERSFKTCPDCEGLGHSRIIVMSNDLYAQLPCKSCDGEGKILLRKYIFTPIASRIVSVKHFLINDLQDKVTEYTTSRDDSIYSTNIEESRVHNHDPEFDVEDFIYDISKLFASEEYCQAECTRLHLAQVSSK